MGNNIASQQVVARFLVRGRFLSVERTTWKNTDGLSFDVTDDATGQCLTPESYDDMPDKDELFGLLDQIDDDLQQETLDPFFDDPEARKALHAIVLNCRC